MIFNGVYRWYFTHSARIGIVHVSYAAFSGQKITGRIDATRYRSAYLELAIRIAD
jgi:hypothetical protein